MDTGFGLLKFLFPQIPALVNTTVWHSLGMAPNSSKWDLRTTLSVQILRQMMSGDGNTGPRSVENLQKTTLKDPGVKGKMWVATEKIPAPGPGVEGIRDAVFQAIEDLAPKDVGTLNYTRPELADLEVEWTGFRSTAKKDEPLPQVSQEDMYQKLMAEPTRTSETTILYLHGGAYYLCDPSTHRVICSRLAKESSGRVCSVRYRLAPQTAFPGQLLDALLVYLSLLYPPPGSMHEAVAASKIVVAGDSAGGNLSFALLQLLLQFHRTSKNPKVLFHGTEVEVPLPAGFCANSGWFDIARTLPSVMANVQYDYLPAPNPDDAISAFADDSIWPSDPPRGDLFCDLSLLDHPLTSVVGAESWQNSPPLYLCTGEEMLRDEDAVVASRAASQGVTVRFEEYEAMPHCFAMLLSYLPTADRCLRSWGRFCRACVEEPLSLLTTATFISAKVGREETRNIAEIDKLDWEKVKRLLIEAKDRRTTYLQKRTRDLPRPNL